MPIPIIDLFAGPGGLNEGFSQLRDALGQRIFRSALSVECEEGAHRTLELRALYRRMRDEDVMADYWSYVRGEISRETLFGKSGYLAKEATSEAMLATLGGPQNQEIEERIQAGLKAAGTKDFVLIGGPPCQAYSIAGRVRKNRMERAEFEKDGRHLLYREYLRIVQKFRPMIFLMENVPGLLSAKHNGTMMFERICQDLREADYSIHSLHPDAKNSEGEGGPSGFVIRTDEFGVPQMRQRVFILGIRRDLGLRALTLERPKTNHFSTVGGVLSDLPKIRSRLSREKDSAEAWLEAILELRRYEFRHLDERLRESLWDRLDAVRGTYPLGLPMVERQADGPENLSRWYVERGCDVVLNHNSRAHMRSDLMRYFFWSHYASQRHKSPRIDDVPYFLRPNHKNLKLPDEDAKIGTSKDDSTPFNDRFRVQLRNQPSTTIVSHIAKDGHYYIHFDPKQCRSLSVREAARLQTFPDSYFFEGPPTRQYQQVGNAVPPYLAHQIAGVVHSILEGRAATARRAG